jgi:hypothetical protein
MYMVDAAKDAADFNWPLLAGNFAVGLVIAIVSARVTNLLELRSYVEIKALFCPTCRIVLATDDRILDWNLD